MNHKVNNLEKFSLLEETEIVDAIEKAVCIASRTIEVRFWSGNHAYLPDGSDARDIVHQVLQGILEGRNNWVEGVNFETFLIQTVKGYISNILQKKEHQITSHLEDSGEEGVDYTPPSDDSPVKALREQESEEILLKIAYALEGKNEEESIINAIIEGCLKRREIISHTGLSSKQYDNALKRLKRFLLSEEWQKILNFHHC